MAFVTGSTEIHVLNIGAGAVTLSGASGVTVSGTTSLAQYAKATIRKTGTDTWVVLASVAAATGDIEGVIAGTGLGGGGTSGTVTLTNTGVTSIVAGTNISISGATGAVTITGTDTNTQLTTEQVQDIVGDMLVGTETRIGVSYDDTNGRINFIVDDMTANTQLSTEEVQDIIGAMIAGNTESGITVTYDDTNGKLDLSVASQTENSFTTTLKNKLDGIEASATADQTAAEIRALVEAASDSNVFTDADHSKLDAIEASATADQTASEIRTLVESASDSNVFTDADHSKLDGVAASANNYAISSDLLDEDNMASNSATKVASQQSIKAYVDSEVAGVVDSAPAALNTLNELAAALGDDANYATTTSTALGNRLRTDTDSQGLTSTQQGNALTNLGITATKAEINILDDGLSASDIPSLAASKITSGTFATARIADDAITAGKLNVTGDGSATQFLRSDGDGSFTWAVPTDTDTNTQLTQEQVEDFVAGVITAGTNVSVTYDDAAGTLTIASTDTNTQLTTEAVQDIVGAMLVGTETRIGVTYDDTNGRINFVVDDMTANDNTQLSTEQVQDIVGAMFTSNTETRITATYQDGDGTIDLVVDDQSSDNNTTYSISAVDGDNTDEEKIRLTDSAGGTDDVVLEAGTGLTIARSGDKITFTNTITDTNTQLTTEQVQDIIGAMVDGGTETNISVTYDDTNGKINFVSTDTNTEYSVGDGGLTQNNFTNTLKTKLDGIATSANNYVHPNHSGEVTSSADGATVIADNVIDEANLKATNSPTDNYLLSYDQATTGFTWIAAGAGGENNQNAFSTVVVSGQDNVVADTATDTLTFVAGSNVTITTTAGQDSITFASADTNTEYSVGDGGLTQNNFTNTLKSKLDGIATSANNYAISSDLLDEDNMASDSASKAASQQSIKAYVDAEVATNASAITAITTGAPSLLNTLDELAAALGDDANFATTTATSLGQKLVKTSNLSDLANAGTARSNLGLGTAATLSGTGAVANGNAGLVTGDVVFDYIAAQGFGTGAGDITSVVAGTGLSGGATSGDATVNLSHLGIESLSDPNGDRLLIWDDSAGAIVFATANSNLAISGTNVNATDTNTEYSVGDGGLTQNNFTNTLKSKLDGIAASANNYALTDDLASGEITQLQNIGATTITATQWGYLGGLTAAKVIDWSTSQQFDDIHPNNQHSAGTNLTLSGTTFNVDDAFLKNDANDTTTGTITAGGFTTAGIVDGVNFKINGGQGSDGQVLTSTGSGVAWEDASSGGGGGGASAIDGLSDASTTATSVWLGSTPANATDYNTSVGIGALDAPNGTNGTKNVALGYNAGTANTEGFKNVFVGFASGTANTNADHNVFVGSQSGKANTTGVRNIAIGSDSYDAADTESDNIAIGYAALGGSVAGGEQNVVVGNYAGDAVTSADGSVIIGHNAGTAVTTGGYNTLLGFEAGAQMTSGYANVAIGRQANRYGNGNDSIAIGFGSLSNADLAGDRNIGIGYMAGNNITSGDGNVVIGNAGVASATGDNQLSISSNSASSPVTWITGNSSGVVNIPGSLTVAGSAVGGGGASDLNGLTDVISNITNFTDSILISPDGAAPPHGTLNNAHSNIGIGKDALSSITSGSNMVAIGFNAAKSVTTAYKAVAIGHKAMENATGVAQAVAIGHQAGRALTGATNTVMIGANAGESLTTGAGSVFIGEAAGYGVTTEAHNIAIGSMALSSGNFSGGTYNVAIGSFVGYAHTSGDNNIGIGSWGFRYLTSGNDNIALGRSANGGVTTGNRNIAIGTSAYDNADTESDNIAIGYDALGGAVNGGEKNIAIGNYTLDALTSADNNVAIGHSAGSSLTTQGSNTMVGWEAGTSSTSVESTYIGYYAGRNNLSNYNTAIGAEAMITYGDKTAERNVAIGNAALKVIQTGDRNTAVGAYNGLAVTTGSDNIFLGYSAGDNITTGDNNVVIGAADVTATGDDQLSISSGDGGVTWITGASTGAVSFPNNQAGNAVAAASTANNDYLTLLEVPHGTYKAIKATVHITDSTNNEVQTMDVMAHYDGSAANFTEYGIIFDGAAAIGSVEADVNGSNLRLRFKNEQGGTATLAASIHAVLLA